MPQITVTLKKNGIFYLAATIIALVLNMVYRSGDSSLLTWILAPTAWWAGILGGISFEPLPGRGYVNEAFRFLIAPSCSGIRFLQIVLLMLVFSYIHRVRTGRGKLFWLTACLGFSYVFTILVNGLRIVLSIYLPPILEEAGLLRILTPEKLHVMIGTAVYFSFLLMLQPAASVLSDRLFSNDAQEGSGQAGEILRDSRRHAVFAFAEPVFWYFLAVLGIPFVKRLVTGNLAGFNQYALPVMLVCLGILLFSAATVIFHKSRKQI